MSWQQVNLYLPELKPRQELLSAKTALVISAVTCFLLVLLSIVGSVKNSELIEVSEVFKQQLDKQTLEIAAIRSTLPRSQAAIIQQEVDKLRLELERRQRIYQLINQQNLGNSDGFSGQLLALARQHESNISLLTFNLHAGGRQFNFTGRAKSAQAVPQYLQRLQKEKSFENTTFGHMAVERSKTGIVNFSLSQEAKVSSVGD